MKKRMRNKKGQAHMTETIAVLFIFFVLVLFGLVFYFKFSQGAAEAQQQEMRSKHAIETVTKVLFLPELACTSGEVSSGAFCVDLMKLSAASSVIQENTVDYYFELFGYAHIVINQTFPAPSKEWVLYSRIKPNATHIEPTFFPISLQDDSLGSGLDSTYGFGYVMVEVYS